MAGNVTSIATKKPVRAPDMTGAAGEDAGERFDRVTLPPGCPVTPLGIQGLKLWVLDASNQLIQFPTDCRKGDMTLVFGGNKWLMDNYPSWSKPTKERPDPVIVGFNQSDAQAALIEACFTKGIFNPQGRVFGRGAHRAGDVEDELVLHLGKSVMITGRPDKRGEPGPIVLHKPGAVAEAFYPALPGLPAPADEPSSGQDAKDLLDLFGGWYWVEPNASPLLLLGMCAQMHICGALRWRSHVWLAGPTAAGKSSLQALIRAIHGGWCLHVEDASEAAIRQVLGDDTLPVMIDEAEADDNPDKQRAILNLAKKASSGAKIIRGGADHKGQEFTAQSCFLFSSVLHSLNKGEERNRMAILQMRQVPADDSDAKQWEPPDMAHWRHIGRKMHRRMIEQWPRFTRTLADYKREIWSHGLEGRWQDTFGTLLACADCLLFDCAPSEENPLNEAHGREKKWVRRILPMLLRGKSEARSDVDRCLAHLMSCQLPGAHGQAPETVGQWMFRAMSPVETELGDEGPNEAARARLKQYGLRLVRLKYEAKKWSLDGEPLPSADGWREGYLAVAYATCKPLADLFRGTEWAGGNYLQSLGKIDGAVQGAPRMRFAGPPDHCIAIPLAAMRGDEE